MAPSSNNYTIIREDLFCKTNSVDGYIPSRPYSKDNSNIQKVKTTLRYLMRSRRMKKRQDTLFYAYFIGALLKEEIDNPMERALCMKEMTQYYQRVTRKTFQLFEKIGPERIAQTKDITLTMVYRLTHHQLQTLEEEQEKAVIIDEVSDNLFEDWESYLEKTPLNTNLADGDILEIFDSGTFELGGKVVSRRFAIGLEMIM